MHYCCFFCLKGCPEYLAYKPHGKIKFWYSSFIPFEKLSVTYHGSSLFLSVCLCFPPISLLDNLNCQNSGSTYFENTIRDNWKNCWRGTLENGFFFVKLCLFLSFIYANKWNPRVETMPSEKEKESGHNKCFKYGIVIWLRMTYCIFIQIFEHHPSTFTGFSCSICV